jgi:hypothetical protein
LTVQSSSSEGYLVVSTVDGKIVPLAKESDVQITMNHSAVISIEWSSLCMLMGYLDTRPCQTSQTGLNPASLNLKVGVGRTPWEITAVDPYFGMTISLAQMSFDAGPSLGETSCGRAKKSYFDFTMFPGDESAYIQDAQVCEAFPFVGNSSVARFVRLFYEREDVRGFARISPASPFQDVTIDDENAQLKNTRIGGLLNGVKYAFKAAFVDAAGNVAYYTPAVMDKEEHSATPDRVRGQVR